MGKDKQVSSGTACTYCKRTVGDAPKVGAMYIDDGSGSEAWCPPCFCYKRMAMEPGRWSGFCPVSCERCGWEMVSTSSRCANCGARFGTKLVLPAEVLT